MALMQVLHGYGFDIIESTKATYIFLSTGPAHPSSALLFFHGRILTSRSLVSSNTFGVRRLDYGIECTARASPSSVDKQDIHDPTNAAFTLLSLLWSAWSYNERAVFLDLEHSQRRNTHGRGRREKPSSSARSDQLFRQPGATAQRI